MCIYTNDTACLKIIVCVYYRTWTRLLGQLLIEKKNLISFRFSGKPHQERTLKGGKVLNVQEAVTRCIE